MLPSLYINIRIARIVINKCFSRSSSKRNHQSFSSKSSKRENHQDYFQQIQEVQYILPKSSRKEIINTSSRNSLRFSRRTTKMLMNVITTSALRWKKYKKLGAGSYGTVYLAGEADSFFLSTSFAAVKSAGYGHATTTIQEAKFLNELKGNPYIIRCFAEDVSIERGEVMYNMLMEYAPGGTLDDLIATYSARGKIMPQPYVARYSYMLLKGLSHVHGKGLVHCDIKPCNILVFPTTRQDGLHHLKLADFGLAKHVWEEGQLFRLPRHRGTRVYASPESIRFGIHGTATDVWSLGCTILEMMTGRLTWTDEDMWDLIDEMVLGPSEVISDLGKDFLRRCFITNPDCRWTVSMLLDHPFILQYIGGLSPVEEYIHFSNNPFGVYDGRIVTKDLFSSPVQPQLFPSLEDNRSYQLFPAGCNCSVTCGVLSLLAI